MVREPEHFTVAFEGDGAGTGELAWGQNENWSTIVTRKDWLPLGGVKPLSPGTTVEEIADELRYLMGRYPPLRTLLRFEADGRATQEVFGSGEIALEIFDVDATDPDRLAEEVCDHYRHADLDFAAQWPIRMGVVRHGSALTHMVVLMSHLAIDATGATVMMQEVAARKSTAIPEMQPLAQAAWQRSPAGRRHADAVLRHWEGIFRTMDPRLVKEPPAPRDHTRYWQGQFTSPAMLPAVNTISERTGVGSSTVLLTLFATSLSALTGINPVAIRPIVGNRFRPGLADVVCTLAQAGLCLLDVADAPFDDMLRRAHQASTKAYKYAYFDHEEMFALRDRVGRERGLDLDTTRFFNDRRGSTGQQQHPDSVPPSSPHSRSAGGPVPASEFRWILGQDTTPFVQMLFQVDDVPDTIQVTVSVDADAISLADVEALMWRIEAMALAAAASETVPTPQTVGS